MITTICSSSRSWRLRSVPSWHWPRGGSSSCHHRSFVRSLSGRRDAAVGLSLVATRGRLGYQAGKRCVARKQAIGEAVGHSTRTIFLSADYGTPLEYHGLLAGRARPTASDLEWEGLAGTASQTAEDRFQSDYAAAAPDYFIVEDMEEYAAQPDLADRLLSRWLRRPTDISSSTFERRTSNDSRCVACGRRTGGPRRTRLGSDTPSDDGPRGRAPTCPRDATAAIGAWAVSRLTGRPDVPPVGRVRFGSLRRVEPLSREFGYDRGLRSTGITSRRSSHEASDVHGRVLEIGDATYTRRYGGDRVTRSDVLHVADAGPDVTIVADLADGRGIPEDSFDCVITAATDPPGHLGRRGRRPHGRTDPPAWRSRPRDYARDQPGQPL